MPVFSVGFFVFLCMKSGYALYMCLFSLLFYSLRTLPDNLILITRYQKHLNMLDSFSCFVQGRFCFMAFSELCFSLLCAVWRRFHCGKSCIFHRDFSWPTFYDRGIFLLFHVERILLISDFSAVSADVQRYFVFLTVRDGITTDRRNRSARFLYFDFRLSFARLSRKIFY